MNVDFEQDGFGQVFPGQVRIMLTLDELAYLREYLSDPLAGSQGNEFAILLDEKLSGLPESA